MTITLTREEAQSVLDALEAQGKKSLWRKRSDKRREEIPVKNS
jgi:hypothetical protein